MNVRLKEIRKTLNLSQEKMGERLGVTKTAISKMELGTYGITDSMAKLVCKEFNIDYIWLTTGKGKMFSDIDSDIMARIDYIMTGEDSTAKRIFTEFAKLNENEWAVIEKIIDGLKK